MKAMGAIMEWSVSNEKKEDGNGDIEDTNETKSETKIEDEDKNDNATKNDESNSLFSTEEEICFSGEIDTVSETVPDENNDIPLSKEEEDQEVMLLLPPPERTKEEVPEKSSTIGENNYSDALPVEKEDT
eukprot:12358855-Ditylum_brightwellii.AAC.2